MRGRTGKKIIALSVVLCCSACGWSASRALHNVSPGDLVLETDRHEKTTIFPHDKHKLMYACAECHHGQDAEGRKTPYTEGMAIKKCGACHNAAAGMKNNTLNSFKKAAHVKCRGCHKKVDRTGKSAPTKCNGCHPQK